MTDYFNTFEKIEELESACFQIENSLPMFAIMGLAENDDRQYLRKLLFQIRCDIVNAKEYYKRFCQDANG